jgi:hypothetical protein
MDNVFKAPEHDSDDDIIPMDIVKKNLARLREKARLEAATAVEQPKRPLDNEDSRAAKRMKEHRAEMDEKLVMHTHFCLHLTPGEGGSYWRKQRDALDENPAIYSTYNINWLITFARAHMFLNMHRNLKFYGYIHDCRLTSVIVRTLQKYRGRNYSKEAMLESLENYDLYCGMLYGTKKVEAAAPDVPLEDAAEALLRTLNVVSMVVKNKFEVKFYPEINKEAAMAFVTEKALSPLMTMYTTKSTVRKDTLRLTLIQSIATRAAILLAKGEELTRDDKRELEQLLGFSATVLSVEEQTLQTRTRMVQIGDVTLLQRARRVARENEYSDL